MNLAKHQFVKEPVAQVFRHLRISAGMKIRDLARLLEVNHTLIVHYEQGRQPIPQERVKRLCKVFNLSLAELEKIINSGEIPLNYRDECQLLLTRMDEDKLKGVYLVLKSMMN